MRGNLALMLQTAVLFGKVESNTANIPEKAAFRLLSPISKLFSGKDCLKIVSEGLEGFGGLGYLEDSNLPVYLRDSQVLPIWEGTTNVLCWDVVRALKKLGDEGLEDFLMWLRMKVDKCYRISEPELRSEKEYGDAFKYLLLVYTEISNTLFDLIKGRNMKLKYEYNLRYAIFALAYCVIGIILLDFGNVGDVYEEEYRLKERNIATFIGWVRRRDFPSLEWFGRFKCMDEEKFEVLKDLAFSGVGEEVLTDLKRPRF